MMIVVHDSLACGMSQWMTRNGGSQVEAKMQELKAKQQSPFTIDKTWLAQQRPGLLLTQDACSACDVDSSAVAQVSLHTATSVLW